MGLHSSAYVELATEQTLAVPANPSDDTVGYSLGDLVRLSTGGPSGPERIAIRMVPADPDTLGNLELYFKLSDTGTWSRLAVAGTGFTILSSAAVDVFGIELEFEIADPVKILLQGTTATTWTISARRIDRVT